jgi:O-antigen ligase
MLKSSLNASLLVALILCLLTATVLFGGVLAGYALPWQWLVALMTLLWAVKLLFCQPVSAVWSPMHVPVAMFAGYAFWRYATSPIEYDSRMETLLMGTCTLVYFLVACNFYRSRDRKIIVGALALLAAGQAAYALWQYRAEADVVLWLDRGPTYHGRGSGTFFCPNHLAGLLEMTLCLLVARVLVRRESHAKLQSAVLVRLYGGAATGLVAAGLFATWSLGGWIAAIVALLTLLLLAELARALSQRMVVAACVAVVAVGAVAWSVPQIRERIRQDAHAQWGDGASHTPLDSVSGLSGRLPLWRATLSIIRDHPMTGTGPGTWSWIHLKYRDPRVQFRPRYAHQDALQLISDYGLVGFGLAAAMLVCFYRHAWRLVCRAASTEQRSFALGTMAAVTAMVAHSLGDFSLHMPANALWMATLMGLTIAQSTDEKSPERSELSFAGRFFLGVTLPLLAVALALVSTRLNAGSWLTELGSDAAQRFEWSEARTLFRRALAYDAGNPDTHAQLGDAYRTESAELLDPSEQSRRQELALSAVDAYRQSLALNPFQSEVLLRQAAAYELAGDTAGALRAYESALSVDPNNAFNWLQLGRFYRRRGEIEKAVEALQRSRQLNNTEPIAQKYLQEIASQPAARP